MTESNLPAPQPPPQERRSTLTQQFIDARQESNLLRLTQLSLALLILAQFFYQAPFLAIAFPILSTFDNTVGKAYTYSRFGAGALSLFVVIWLPRRDTQTPLSTWLILGFPAFCLLSTSWSIDYQSTLRPTIETALILAFGVLASQRMNAILPFAVIAKYCVFILLASALLARFVPSIGTHNHSDLLSDIHGTHVGNWRGVFVHKNLLGGFAAASLVIFACYPRLVSRIPWRAGAGILLALMCLLFSKSITAMITAFAAIGIVWSLRFQTRLGVPRAFLLAVICMVFAIAVALFTQGDGVDLFRLTGRDATFSGRTQIWQVAMEQFQFAPWFGSGFAASGPNLITPRLKEEVGPAAVDVHSGYIYLLTEGGFVGAALFIVLVAGALFSAIIVAKRQPFPGSGDLVSTYVGIIVMTLLYGVTEVNGFEILGAAGFFFFLSIGLLYGLATLKPTTAAPARPQPRPRVRRGERPIQANRYPGRHPDSLVDRT